MLHEDEEADEEGYICKTFEHSGHKATVRCCAVYRGTLVADGVDYTGLLVWQASTVLAHFIGARSDIFANKSCIELGSGAGLTGLFCAQFARKTIMTDRNDDVLDLLRANIERNGLSPEQCSVASLDWGEPLLDDVAKGAPYEVVLASDVIYPGHTAEIVGRLFKSAVSLMGPSTPFVVSYVPRDNSVTQLIFDAAEAYKLKCTEVPTKDFMPGPPPLGAKMFTFARTT